MLTANVYGEICATLHYLGQVVTQITKNSSAMQSVRVMTQKVSLRMIDA